MGQFDRAIETAKRLIEKNGQPVTWRKLVVDTPSPSAPWKPVSEGVNEYSTIICFLPLSRVGEELIRYLRGTEVTTGSVKGLMPVVDFEPSANDVVISNGNTLRIKSIDTLSPNGQIIVYTIEFDR